MSRDAKVGLVIIFSFVFLLGTILVHRFHRAQGELTSTPVETSEPPGTFAVSGRQGAFGESSTPDTVEAVATDPTFPAITDESPPSREPMVAETARTQRNLDTTRPPAHVPPSSANGAHISVTDVETTQPPAAVVEPSRSSIRNQPKDSGGDPAVRAKPNDRGALPTHRTPPLLEIGNTGKVQRENVADVSHPDPENDSDDARDMVIVQGEVADDKNSMNDSTIEPDMQTETVAAETHTRPEPPSSSFADSVATPPSTEIEESVDTQQVQQASGGSPEAPTPPRLPKFGESRQATIEPVGPRKDARNDDSQLLHEDMDRRLPQRTTGPSQYESDDRDGSSVHKVYVVKEGDSFWSISAKHYGSGKYFRALEDFNRHRIPAYDHGKRVLQLGTEILLPDLSVLRSRSAAKQPESMSARPPADSLKGRDAHTASDDHTARGTRSQKPLATGHSATRHGTWIYRVQEGDTLSTIALRELGTSRRWQEIYELNREELADERTLKIGMELKMPAVPPSEKLADHPQGGR